MADNAEKPKPAEAPTVTQPAPTIPQPAPTVSQPPPPTKIEQPSVSTEKPSSRRNSSEVATVSKPQDKKMDLVLGELKTALANKAEKSDKEVEPTPAKEVPVIEAEKVVDTIVASPKPTIVEVSKPKIEVTAEVKPASIIEVTKAKPEVIVETKATPVATIVPSTKPLPEVKKDETLLSDPKTTIPLTETSSIVKKLDAEILPRRSSITDDNSLPDLPVRMRRRPKPGSSNWTRPHSALYESNYATSSRIYSNAMSRIEAKSEVPLSLDDYRSTDADSYAESLVGSAVTRAATRYATRARASTSRARELSLSRPASWMVTNDDKSVIEERLRLKGIERYSVAPSSVVSQPVLPYMGSRRGSSHAPSVIGDDLETLVDHEYDARKQHNQEIEQLNEKLSQAEAKVKTEVQKTKKSMINSITELEAALDAANTQNIDLQKTVKRQANQIMELKNHSEEMRTQLQVTIDQVGISQRRNQGLQNELDEVRSELENVQRAKRAAEASLEESEARVEELETVTFNLTSIKAKLQSELSTVQTDYEELNRELGMADERYQRTVLELKSTKSALVEESERVIKMETLKKAVENEMKQLTIRAEEAEATAISSSKKIVAKLEARIRDMELEVEDEKRLNVEAQKQMRKREHRIKEILAQAEEDQKNMQLLQDMIDKLNEKLKVYKRQLIDQENSTQQNLQLVRKYQRELEAAEERAEAAETSLSNSNKRSSLKRVERERERLSERERQSIDRSGRPTTPEREFERRVDRHERTADRVERAARISSTIDKTISRPSIDIEIETPIERSVNGGTHRDEVSSHITRQGRRAAVGPLSNKMSRLKVKMRGKHPENLQKIR